MPNLKKNRFTIIPAVYLILEKDSKFLFLKRSNSGYMDGFYQFPAGHLEGGETLKQAMIREAKEEVALDIQEKDLDLVFTAHRFVEKGVERIDFFFKSAKFNELEIKNNEPEKCSEIVWLNMNNQKIVPYIKTVLTELQNGKNYIAADFKN
jgi:mutator protein MutT